MADRTGIEWTESTWNPIVGCSLVSPGCTNCYAMRMAGRIVRMNPGSHYDGTVKDTKAGAVWTGVMNPAPDHILAEPLRWRRPRYVFVNSMSDLFHEGVPDDLIDRVFAVMALALQHTFQILTKRPERMRSYLRDVRTPGRIARVLIDMCLIDRTWPVPAGDHWPVRSVGDIDDPSDVTIDMPLSNVWLGVSTEDQRRADERIPLLLDTPAAVRWISAEPLVGPIDFTSISLGEKAGVVLGEDGEPDQPENFHVVRNALQDCNGAFERLDWIVVGGESGRGARPMHPDWARSIRDQCAAAGVPFLFKQHGEWSPRRPAATNDLLDARKSVIIRPDGGTTSGLMAYGPDAWIVDKVGKRVSGRHLDGVLHDAYPQSGEIPFQP